MSETDPKPSPKTTKTAATTLRLASVLATQKKREGSYVRLHERIQEAIDQTQRHRSPYDVQPKAIDRRKLKDIVDGVATVSLSLQELAGLDAYLEPLGAGLSKHPMLEKPELMSQLSKPGKVDFLLGSRRDARDPLRRNISHWDFLGLNAIQQKVLNRSEKKLDIEIRLVRRPPYQKDDDEKFDGLMVDSEFLRPFEKNGPSLVCLACSRSNLMAERMLSRMWQMTEFEPDQESDAKHLPFRFVWAQDTPFVPPSAFHLAPEIAARDEPRFGKSAEEGGPSGFRVGDRNFVDELTIRRSEDETRSGDTFALCAAQMRENGQIWLLVAGLTGPGTYAAANWVHLMGTSFDQIKAGQRSPVFWNILRARATRVAEPGRGGFDVELPEVVARGEA